MLLLLHRKYVSCEQKYHYQFGSNAYEEKSNNEKRKKTHTIRTLMLIDITLTLK